MTLRGSILLASALLLASGCSNDGDAPAPDQATTDEPAQETAPPAGEAPEDGRLAADASTIPAGMQGRWGRTAADCEPGRLDALGLVAIDANTIEFYESVARLESVAEHAPDRLRGTFAFEGEGMTWQLDVLMELDGDTLVRTEFGDEAMEQPSTYMRCK